MVATTRAPNAPTGSRFTVGRPPCLPPRTSGTRQVPARSDQHTSELQSRSDLVCRLLLEKKNERRLRPNPCRPDAGPVGHRTAALTGMATLQRPTVRAASDVFRRMPEQHASVVQPPSNLV